MERYIAVEISKMTVCIPEGVTIQAPLSLKRGVEELGKQ